MTDNLNNQQVQQAYLNQLNTHDMQCIYIMIEQINNTKMEPSKHTMEHPTGHWNIQAPCITVNGSNAGEYLTSTA